MKKRKRIILIDDDHGILDLLEVYLYEDYEITTADELLPDFIITDIMMPVMDGIKFLSTLRKRPQTAHIPVIAVTSFNKMMNAKSLLNLGFNGVIFKPLKREAVLETIDHVFGKK
jgi:CheY-like chemotaxis protein